MSGTQGGENTHQNVVWPSKIPTRMFSDHPEITANHMERNEEKMLLLGTLFSLTFWAFSPAPPRSQGHVGVVEVTGGHSAFGRLGRAGPPRGGGTALTSGTTNSFSRAEYCGGLSSPGLRRGLRAGSAGAGRGRAGGCRRVRWLKRGGEGDAAAAVASLGDRLKAEQ